MKQITFGIIAAFALNCSTSLFAGDGESKPDKPFQYEAGDIKIPGAYADEPVIKLSTQKAAEYLEKGSLAWTNARKCVACHTNGTYLFIRPALSKTLGKPKQETRDSFVSQLNTIKKTSPGRLKRSGTRPAQVVYIAAGLAEWDAHISKKLSAETDEALRLMLELQMDDGSFHSLDCWPPFESSAYQEATMAAIAIASAPGWLESLADDDSAKASVDKLIAYIRDTKPPHDYARVLKLWTGQRMSGILTTEETAATIKLLRSRQQKDGGWSMRHFAKPAEWGGGNRAAKLQAEPNFKTPDSDGHMTGLALLVMQESGVSNEDAQMKRGLDWLRSNQRESGRWWARSLNTDTYHLITYSGTAYALLALQNASSK